MDLFGENITFTQPATGGWEEMLSYLSIFALVTVGIGAAFAGGTLYFFDIVSKVFITSWVKLITRKAVYRYGLEAFGIPIAFIKYCFNEW